MMSLPRCVPLVGVLIAVGVGVALGVILGGVCLIIVSSYLKK